MNIISRFSDDVKSPEKPAGGYEWWYFDGYDPNSDLGFVIIFYEGNPFSPHYIHKSLELNHKPDEHPAISISVYKNGRPIFYAFRDYQPGYAEFSEKRPYGRVGNSTFEGFGENGEIVFNLELNERLPSGDSIKASITFKGKEELFEPEISAKKHSWNLVSARASIEGFIKVNDTKLPLNGFGYHDHNTGLEPMHHEFDEWYWGRVHFKEFTLVYYLMRQRGELKCRAWVSPDSKSRETTAFERVKMRGFRFNLFGLRSARSFTFGNEEWGVEVKMLQVIDNGPFYQRFLCKSRLHMNEVENESTGISEYIRPERISKKAFWPLINMRLNYEGEPPHWVQKSRFFYKLTW